MKRFIALFITVIVCFLLQTSVFQYFKLAGITPNILLILVVSFALMRGRKEGLIIGFFCGLLIDIFYGDYIGVYAFIYMCLGYFNGYFNRMFYVDDIVLPLAMVTGNGLLYNFFIYVIFFLLKNKLDFWYYAKSIIIPEVVYTTLITIIIYKLLLWINSSLEYYEKRSVN